MVIFEILSFLYLLYYENNITTYYYEFTVRILYVDNIPHTLYLCCVCVTRVHWYAYLQWFWGSVFLRRWFVFIPWPSCYNWITNEIKLLIVLRPIFKGTCISPVNDMQLEKVYARICFPTVACCCYRLQLDVYEQVFFRFSSRFIS